MSKLQELLAQKAALDLEIASIRKNDLADAIAKVRAICSEFNLTEKDVFPNGKGRSANKTGGKVPAKYRDPVSGKTWSGRGMEPKWLEGDRSKFAIESASE